MPVDSIASSLTPSLAASASPAQMDQIRNADFLKIMMSELAQQDPFKPADTAEIVDNMQKLQQLANTQFQKFREDQSWAQDLVGKSVNVKQMAITDDQAKALKANGLSPDVGYANASGTVDSFRVVNQTVYLSVGGHDYPMDNVTQVNPSNGGGAYLADIANGLLGRKVAFTDPTTAKTYSGTVQSVQTKDGKVVLGVDGYSVPLEQVNRIGVADAP